MAAKGKPQRRTLVQSLENMVAKVEELNLFGGLDGEKSFRPLLRAAASARKTLQREREHQRLERTQE